MPRPFIMPAPKHRSVNEPTKVVSANQVRGLYNQITGKKKERIVDSVKDCYTQTMTENGWQNAVLHGNQCVLTANVKLDSSIQ